MIELINVEALNALIDARISALGLISSSKMSQIPTLQQVLDNQTIGARECAQRCGVSYSSINDILIGRTRRPKPETARKIKAGLGVREIDFNSEGR